MRDATKQLLVAIAAPIVLIGGLFYIAHGQDAREASTTPAIEGVDVAPDGTALVYSSLGTASSSDALVRIIASQQDRLEQNSTLEAKLDMIIYQLRQCKK